MNAFHSSITHKVQPHCSEGIPNREKLSLTEIATIANPTLEWHIYNYLELEVRVKHNQLK